MNAKPLIYGMVVVAILVGLYCLPVNHYAWSPKAKAEAADNIAVREACIVLGDIAKQSTTQDGGFPLLLAEIAPAFKKALNDTSYVFDDPMMVTRHGYRIEYHPSVYQGKVVGFRVVMIDLNWNEDEVYVWYPGAEVGG